MKFWRTIEVVGCFTLLTLMTGIAVSSMITTVLEEATKVVLQEDIHAFLDGRTNTYKGFDSASMR